MTVELLITSAQANVLMFDFYSNVDGFVVPFETNVPVGSLIIPYTTTLVPDNTTIIKVKNVGGLCTNFIDIILQTTTTTTTTLPPATTTTTTTVIPEVPCDAVTTSGGTGVTSLPISLSSEGGIIIIDFNAVGVVDKLEIVHNNVRKATTGMSVSNAGPFDTLYGDPTVPSISQANSVDQFIGSNKGSIPTRNAEFLSETGLTGFTSQLQQLVWWEYTNADYLINSVLEIRVTGPSGTAWNFKRRCVAETTTTTTTTPPTTTTTTTVPEITTTTTTTLAPITTTTTTTEAPAGFPLELIFIDEQSNVYSYSPDVNTKTLLFTPVDVSQDTGLAFDEGAIWLSNDSGSSEGGWPYDEYTYTISPFAVTLGRQVYVNEFGAGGLGYIVQKDANTLLAVKGGKLYEVNLTATPAPTWTEKYDVEENLEDTSFNLFSRYKGALTLTTNNKIILPIQIESFSKGPYTVISSEVALAQYNNITGTLELRINLGTTGIQSIVGLYQYNEELYIVEEDGKQWKINHTYPYDVTYINDIPTASLITNMAQFPSSRTVSFIPRVGLKSFKHSSQHVECAPASIVATPITAYHNGKNTYPYTGDTVYTNASGTNTFGDLDQRQLENGYYFVCTGGSGVVANFFRCPQ